MSGDGGGRWSGSWRRLDVEADLVFAALVEANGLVVARLGARLLRQVDGPRELADRRAHQIGPYEEHGRIGLETPRVRLTPTPTPTTGTLLTHVHAERVAQVDELGDRVAVLILANDNGDRVLAAAADQHGEHVVERERCALAVLGLGHERRRRAAARRHVRRGAH